MSPTRADLVDEVARLHDTPGTCVFQFYSSPDPKDARMTLAGIDQGRLGAAGKRLSISATIHDPRKFAKIRRACRQDVRISGNAAGGSGQESQRRS